MGRLPQSFGGRKITYRIPYAMYGKLNYLADSAALVSQPVDFPSPTFQHNVDKPFEIHRMIPRGFPVVVGTNVYGSAPYEEVGGVVGVDEDFLYTVTCRVKDISRDQYLMKDATPIANLTKGDEQTWEFSDPLYLERSEGLIITIDRSLRTAAANAALLSVQIAFEGFLVVTSPVSDQRG